MVRSAAVDVDRKGHPSLPIVPQIDMPMRAEDRDRIDLLAARLLRDEPALNATGFFGPDVSTGLTDAPALVYEDHREISLFSAAEDTPLEYRSLLLAGDGDIVLLGETAYPEFEAYCRDILALGAPDILHLDAGAQPQRVPLASRCLADPSAMARLCDAGRNAGALNVVPYIGMGTAWKLAGAIAGQTGCPVHVAAPPPRLTRRVNNKIWFAAQARTVLQRDAVPPSYSVFGPAALAGRIAALASRFAQVVVKVPDSAGSLGNVVMSAADIEKWPLASLRDWILASLRERGWRDIYPLLVGVWDEGVFASPSVNLWIPAIEQGPPVLEGIFMQALRGSEGEFVGAAPSNLPPALDRRIAGEAMALGYLFQRLGYFGRCGFDAVLTGPSPEGAVTHWIECNGRWGGVSTPITLANRLTESRIAKGIVIVQQSRFPLPPRSFTETLDLLDGMLLRRPRNRTGIVLLTPGRLVTGSGVNFMALGENETQARRLAATAISRLVRPAPQAA